MFVGFFQYNERVVKYERINNKKNLLLQLCRIKFVFMASYFVSPHFGVIDRFWLNFIFWIMHFSNSLLLEIG